MTKRGWGQGVGGGGVRGWWGSGGRECLCQGGRGGWVRGVGDGGVRG